jgi:type VI secretion system protein ImpL
LRLAILFDTHPYAEFTVASLGPAAAALFVGADGKSAPHPVPGRYTIAAYRDVVVKEAPTIAAQLASEAWVLEPSPAGGSAATGEFMASYRGSYAKAWADLVDDLHLKPAANNQEATQQAQALGAPDGPLALLLRAIVRQTSPAPPDGSSGPIAPGDPLAVRFTALAGLVTPDTQGSSPLDAVMESFRELGRLRAPLAPGAASVVSTATARDRVAHIVAAAGRAPEPVHSMLLTLAVLPAGAPVQTAAASPAALSRQVSARLGVACIRLVAGRFPFARSAARDASLEDFSRMFAPKGAFDEVFAQMLAAHVDTSSETWRPRGPGPSPEAEELERFRSAARIRDVFFARGGAQPAIQLTFRPLDMDQDIDRFQLEVDGQFVRYAHGPLVPTSVKWPGARGSARIDVTPATQGEPLEFSGPWALFRLMDHAAVQDSGAPGRFRVVFDVGGHHTSFEVESNSGANPFRLRELERFDCPISGGP